MTKETFEALDRTANLVIGLAFLATITFALYIGLSVQNFEKTQQELKKLPTVVERIP